MRQWFVYFWWFTQVLSTGRAKIMHNTIYTLFFTQVNYLSDCSNGGSKFSAAIKKKARMEIGMRWRVQARECDARPSSLCNKVKKHIAVAAHAYDAHS